MQEGYSYIKLVTKKPLSSRDAHAWVSIVDRIGPNGVIGNAEITVKGQPKTTAFYAKKTKNGMEYVVPLTRDLTIDEAGRISIAWDKSWTGGDFTVDFSQIDQCRARKKEERGRVVDVLSEEIAKRLHNDWVNVLVSDHWNYGTRYSRANKTHPNLLPWEQLPKKQRAMEAKRVGDMIDILGSINLRLVHV